MKAITKITFLLLAITMFFAACSKNKDDVKPTVAKEITAEELLDYQIVEDIGAKPEYINQIISNASMWVFTFSRDLASSKIYIDYHAPGRHFYDEVDITYNAETGITTVPTDFGYLELTRDKNNQIEAKGGHYFNENSKKLYSKYIQIVKRAHDVFYNQTYKTIDGNGYYRFSSNKWRYKQDTAPTYAELTWDYSQRTNTVWWGKDGGTAQYWNLFVIIPKENGWKGNHQDKNLLIVYVYDNIYNKQIGDIAVCELYN